MLERVIEEVEIERIIDAVAKRDDFLEEKERNALLEILKKIKEKKKKAK